jgi:hypothetical protein
MKKSITILVMLAVIAAGAIIIDSCGGGGGSAQAPPERITFSGGGELGIFDPSIARDPGDGKLWMSYSAVDSSVFYSTDLYWSVSIRLAHSDDNGGTWTDAGIAAAPYTERVVGPMTVTAGQPAIGGTSAGIWQSETSSLIYDPGAPAGERWKLIWFQYLNANLVSYFLDYSWIAMKTAATPLDLATATPVKLFGGFGIQPQGEITGSPSFSPIGGPAAVALNADLTTAAVGESLSDLTSCVFAEPGLAATDTTVYLSIFCMDVSVLEESLLHFKCDSPCDMANAAGWEYLGKLLTPADAADAVNRDHYQAPAVVRQGGMTYLLATPVDTSVGNRYDGCRVYEFTDIDTSALLRDGGGDLIEVTAANGQPDLHNGACEALDGMDGGIIYSQFDPANVPETFRIYKSQVNIP